MAIVRGFNWLALASYWDIFFDFGICLVLSGAVLGGGKA